MKIGIFITARLGSTRLARKHLSPVAGRPILGYLLLRIQREFSRELAAGELEVVITTSDQAENRAFDELFSDGVRVFYGSKDNIPLRHLQAAKAHGVDGIVAVDGDDILCSVRGMRSVLEALRAGAAYVKTAGLPFGMNCMGYATAFIERCIRGHEAETLETGWGRVFQADAVAEIRLSTIPDDPRLRFTLDYPEDYRFFSALVEAIGDRIVDAGDEAIVQTVLERGLYEITEPISRKYWDNFYRGWEDELRQSQEAMQAHLGDREEVRQMGHAGPDLWKRACAIIPGGGQLLSKRSERFLPGLWPAYYSKAKGCEVWDLDGNHFYDFAQMGVGSCALGYADDDVNAAVDRAVRDGSMCTLNCPEEVELAERMIALHPWADMVRFARTGGEACAIAVRIARAASGRAKIAFCGYHGWHDWYLSANLGNTSNLDGQLLPGLNPLGVPRMLQETALPFNYGRLNELEAIADHAPGEIGAIIMEPVRGTSPPAGFLEGVRALATRIGAVLIFDEVTSGFRMNVGGIHLQYNVQPDIAVLGKAMGNGYPIAAIVGRREVMDCAQNTFISSTFWTERIGYAAALATIEKMQANDVPASLVRYGARISAGWSAVALRHGLKISVSGIPPLTHISFQDEDPLAAQTLYAQEMLGLGFLAGAAVYTTYAYSDAIIDKYIAASDGAFTTIRKAIESGDVRSWLKGEVIDVGFKRLNA